MAILLFESTRPVTRADFTSIAVLELRRMSKTLTCVIAPNGGHDLYWTAMEIAENSNHEIVFIGLDESTDSPADEYHLACITSLPKDVRKRTPEQTIYYKALVNSFLDTINKLQYTTEDINRICNVCVLGPDPYNSAAACCNMYFSCLNRERWLSEQLLVDIPHYDYYSNSNLLNTATYVRVLAHLCYLSKAIPSTPKGVVGPLNKLITRIRNSVVPQQEEVYAGKGIMVFEGLRELSSKDFPYVEGQGYTMYDIRGNFTSFPVDGDLVPWYKWGVELAKKSNGTISFIGIERYSKYYVDRFSLESLSSMPVDIRRRTNMQSQDFEFLVNKFLEAIRAFKYSDDFISDAAKACSLGEDPYESYKYCRMLFYEALVKDISEAKKYLFNTPHPECCSSSKCPNRNTYIRFMAHMCYLAQCEQPKQEGALFRIASAVSRYVDKELFGVREEEEVEDDLDWLRTDYRLVFGEDYEGELPDVVTAMSEEDLRKTEVDILIQMKDIQRRRCKQ